MSKLHERLWGASRSCYRNGWYHAAQLIKGLNFLLHHCLLPQEAEVGADVRLEHHGLGVVLHPQVKLGDRVRIYHQVTVAAESCMGSQHRVTIGSDAELGVGCKIIARANSGLSIGEGAVIGANAVVTRDVPPWEIWAGVPARRIGDVRNRRLRLGLPMPATAEPFSVAPIGPAKQEQPGLDPARQYPPLWLLLFILALHLRTSAFRNGGIEGEFEILRSCADRVPIG